MLEIFCNFFYFGGEERLASAAVRAGGDVASDDDADAFAGAYTSTVKQSSLPMNVSRSGVRNCGHTWPCDEQSRTSLHGVTGCGGCQRNASTGGAANGMENHRRTAPPHGPWPI